MAGQLSEDQISEYKEVFSLFDSESDGTIKVKDLKPVLHALMETPTDDEIQQMIKDQDIDDDTIPFYDFLEMIVRRNTPKEVDPEDQLRAAFKMLDRKGDGHLELSDLRLVMRNLGDQATDEHFNRILEEVPVDVDGRINYEHFINAVLG